MEAKWYDIKHNIILQDNQSVIRIEKKDKD